MTLLYCRNSRCEYFTLPIEDSSLDVCPRCGTKLLGGSVEDSRPVDPRPPSPPATPPKNPDPPRPPETRGLAIKPRPTPRPRPRPEPIAVDPKHTVIHTPDGVIQRTLVLQSLTSRGYRPLDLIDLDEPRRIPLLESPESKHALAELEVRPDGKLKLTPTGPAEKSQVFLRIKNTVRLVSGARFRIGRHLIEARLDDPLASKDDADPGLRAHGRLVFIRSDGTDGLSFPVLQTIAVGRGDDKRVDIPLADDDVSTRHALVAPDGTALKLKDLASGNGTYLRLTAPATVAAGDYFSLGDAMRRLVPY